MVFAATIFHIRHSSQSDSHFKAISFVVSTAFRFLWLCGHLGMCRTLVKKVNHTKILTLTLADGNLGSGSLSAGFKN